MHLMGHASKCVIQSELLPGRLCNTSKQNSLKLGGQACQMCTHHKKVCKSACMAEHIDMCLENAWMFTKCSFTYADRCLDTHKIRAIVWCCARYLNTWDDSSPKSKSKSKSKSYTQGIAACRSLPAWRHLGGSTGSIITAVSLRTTPGVREGRDAC